ncbi:hypothetical protein D8I24_7152 [Cupriavidus necator H850]|nr:hypothetical protein D8I24_7152 [Cupriavidus necator H850]
MQTLHHQPLPACGLGCSDHDNQALPRGGLWQQTGHVFLPGDRVQWLLVFGAGMQRPDISLRAEPQSSFGR